MRRTPTPKDIHGRRRRRHYDRHGLETARGALTRYGERAIDPSSSVGQALAAWKRQLVDDLGGERELSAAQLELIDVSARTKLLLDSVDSWLLSQDSLINKRNRSLIPVVRERCSLVFSLNQTLAAVGLKRRRRRVLDRFGDAETERKNEINELTPDEPTDATPETHPGRAADPAGGTEHCGGGDRLSAAEAPSAAPAGDPLG